MLNEEELDQGLDGLVSKLKSKSKIKDLTAHDYNVIEQRLLFLLWAHPAMIPSVESIRKGAVLFRETTGITRHGLIYKAMVQAQPDCHATAVYDQLSTLRDQDPLHNEFRFAEDVLEIYDNNWWRARDMDVEVSEIVYCTEKLMSRKRT